MIELIHVIQYFREALEKAGLIKKQRRKRKKKK